MNSNKIVCSLVIALFVSGSTFATEKSSQKKNEKKEPEHQRGWIGGEYKLVRSHWNWFMSSESVVAFPRSLAATYSRGLLITSVGTNTPAYLAGLREGDLILEVDHTKITSLPDFRKKIDGMPPGSPLTIRTYRNDEVKEYDLTLGRETYRHQGVFAISLLPILRQPNLKFDPDFSLIALGLSWNKGDRAELGSPEQVYRRKCSTREVGVSNSHWRAWLAVISVEHYHQIRSQEIVTR
jgi:Trypsin-like serine proteases, typically periplasmic, contain C-terminal PDZ domain